MTKPLDEKATGSQVTRHRVSLLLLLIGVGALLIGVGLSTRRGQGRRQVTSSSVQTDPSPASDGALASAAFQTWLIYSTVILIIFVAASYTIARIGRRHRSQMARQSHEVTPTPDIWRMHRPPEDLASLGNDSESEAGAH